MPCPTCDHMLTGLGHGLFWCPRCGTIKDMTNDITDTAVPKLVDRCREFDDWFEQFRPNPVPFVALWHCWHRIGIDEAIHHPEHRRPT